MGEKSLRGGVVVLLVLAAMVFQACFVVAGGDSDQDELYGGTLRVALKGEVTDLNPLTATDDQTWEVLDLVYDSLARLKVGTNNSVFPEPWLAESWAIVDDDHVNVKLRSGLKWHDGTEVTATDVVYSFTDPNGMKKSLRFGDILTNLSAVQIGTYNVQFNLSNYDNKGWFFTRVLTVPIIPSTFSGIENGCGPYKFSNPPNPIYNQLFSVSDEFVIREAKGDETRASVKHRFVQPGYSFKASIDNETLNDAANGIEEINQTTGLAKLSYSSIVSSSEQVFINGIHWKPSPLNYTMDYAAGEFTLVNPPPSFNYSNDIVRITYFPTWDEGQNYTVDFDSGSFRIFNTLPPNDTIPAKMNLTASYSFQERSLTLESFDDYFYRKNPYNRGPYLDEIVYTFYPDNPNTPYFDEGADKAIIDLILRNIDAIGFSLTSGQASEDRIIDPENGIITKLTDETWKTIASFDNYTYANPEAEADNFIRMKEKGTYRKRMVHAVQENISGEWTMVESYDALSDCNKHVDENPPGLRCAETWLVQEFFLALDDNPGFRVLYLGFNTLSEPLNDIKFRLAIANLTDRNTHYSLIGSGKEIGHSLVIPQNAYWYNASIPEYKLEHYEEDNSPKLAPVNLQLDLGDYLDVTGPTGGSDGFRDLPNGQEFSLTLKIPPITTDPPESAIGASIVDLLNRVGINTTVEQASWADIQDDVIIDDFNLALGMLETDVDPYFLFDFLHSDKVGITADDTNYNNYIPIETMVNETLHYDTIQIDIMTNTTQLSRTNLVVDSEKVYRNDTLWPSSNYNISYEEGTFELTNLSFNHTIDRLNITYDYRLFDHLLEGADSALGFEDRQGYVRDVLGVAATHVPMVPLVYYQVLEAYDRTVYDGWVDMPGGINNFWSYIGLRYIPAGYLTVDVDSDTNTLKSNQTANIIVTAKNEEGDGIGGVFLQLRELNGMGTLADVQGYTEGDGSFSTKYTSPTVSDVTDVTIAATGTIERYFDGEGLFTITVYPDFDEFLTTMSKDNATIDSGDTTGVTLVVTSQKTGLPVANADVTIDILPSGFDASVTTYSGQTDSTGTFTTDFTASVSVETFFRISAKVSKDGFADKDDSTSVRVSPVYDTDPPSLIGIAEISLIVLVIALLILYLLLMVMGKGGRPKAAEETKPKVEEEKPEKEAEAEEGEEEEIEQPDDDWADEERDLEEEELGKEKSDSD